MKFDIKFDKEMLIGIGKKAGQLGKVVVVEGVKAVALKGAAKVITTSFDEGFSGVKNLTFDEVTGIDKKKKKSKKKLLVQEADVVEEILEVAIEDTVEDKLNKAKELLEDK
jgi:hypothetical protein